MKRLLIIALLVCPYVLDAQSPLQIRRGISDSLWGVARLVGQPLWTTDSCELYVDSDSGKINIGGMYSAYGRLTYAVDAQGSDTYVVTFPNFVLRGYFAGMTVRFKANTVNTGAATINVNSLGAKAITKNGTTALNDGDIAAGSVVTITYDGTQFQLQGNVFGFNTDIVPTTANSYDLGSTASPVDTGYAKAWKETGHENADNFFSVPNIPFLTNLGAGSSSYTQALNDTIYIVGIYLQKAIKLGKLALMTGTLSGSSPVRTVSCAVYNYNLARVDTTAATAYAASDDMSATFQNGGVAGPGFVYVAFSLYFSTSGTMRFMSATFSASDFGGAVFGAQIAGRPIVGFANEKLSAGTGWPATITTKAPGGTGVTVPYMFVFGTNLD